MTSSAFYGCEFVNHNSTDDITHEDFVEMLAKTISFKPKLWNMVKFTTASVDDKYMHRRFSVIFNNIADNDEYADSMGRLTTHRVEIIMDEWDQIKWDIELDQVIKKAKNEELRNTTSRTQHTVKSATGQESSRARKNAQRVRR